jgi:hypothetical protein
MLNLVICRTFKCTIYSIYCGNVGAPSSVNEADNFVIIRNFLDSILTYFRYSFIPSFIHQWLYSSLLGPGHFFSFVFSFTQTVGFLGLGISPTQGRYLNRTTQTQNKRTQRHPCLELDSNSQYQRPSERRRLVPLTARPLWSDIYT